MSHANDIKLDEIDYMIEPSRYHGISEFYQQITNPISRRIKPIKDIKRPISVKDMKSSFIELQALIHSQYITFIQQYDLLVGDLTRQTISPVIKPPIHARAPSSPPRPIIPPPPPDPEPDPNERHPQKMPRSQDVTPPKSRSPPHYSPPAPENLEIWSVSKPLFEKIGQIPPHDIQPTPRAHHNNTASNWRDHLNSILESRNIHDVVIPQLTPADSILLNSHDPITDSPGFAFEQPLGKPWSALHGILTAFVEQPQLPPQPTPSRPRVPVPLMPQIAEHSYLSLPFENRLITELESIGIVPPDAMPGDFDAFESEIAAYKADIQQTDITISRIMDQITSHESEYRADSEARESQIRKFSLLLKEQNRRRMPKERIRGSK